MGNALAFTSATALLDSLSFSADASASARFGAVVQRPTATLPQTAVGALFTVAGGRIAIMSIIGEVTTVIQTQANNTKIVHDPTAVGSNVDLCAVLSITAKAVGTLFGISGVFADAMLSGLAIPGMAPVIVQAGTIALDCAASNTGSVKWTIRWMPLDVGATVVAA